MKKNEYIRSQHTNNKYKRGFMLVESLIGIYLIGMMVVLLVANQQIQIQKLGESEAALARSREQFHQLNAVQFGASIHEGISIDLARGMLEDQRYDKVEIFKIQN
ncbi:type II secretion system protein [Aerococcus viridans]|nr:type II secretion system protein [Aerococcus viridans]